MSVQSDCAAAGLGVNAAGTACAQPIQGSSAAPGFIAPPYSFGASLPTNFTDQLAQDIPGPGIGPAPGQCPMQPDGSCVLNGGTIGCGDIRECDPYTGANHFTPPLPSGPSPNANIWSVDAKGNPVWLGPNGTPTTPPNYGSPPYLDHGVFTSQYNPTQQAKLTAINIVGAQYDPSAGWVPAAGSAPVETSPSQTAYVNTSGPGPSTQQRSTPTNTNPSTAKYAATGAAGAPGTSGVKTPSTTKPSNHAMLLIAAAIAIIILSRV